MTGRKITIAAIGATAAGLLSMPASAQAPAPAAGQSSMLPAAASVASFYATHGKQGIWFRGGDQSAAAAQLVSILERAPFDGLATGPQVAAEVRAALSRAMSRQPADVMAAEQAMSAAWVQYVQAIKRPTPGMVYAIPVLGPQGTRADQILLTAAAAPSLDRHLATVSSVNPMYAQLRDTAWAQAQASGNMTPDPRLLANLERIRSIPSTGKFIVVDSGTQLMTMFENGRPVDSMKIVVGKTGYETPMIASIMYYIVYNPYWNAPDHLVRKIAQNYLSMGDKYLKSRGYQVMKDWTAASAVVPNDQVNWKAVASGKEQIRIRQKPQDDNSMGDLKFPFVNDLDIFLHDTPHKEYFGRANRYLSNGCVRLEDARRFGRWLLGTEPKPPGDDAEIQVQLPRGVPIYLTYTTAQARDGKLSYLPDAYGWDRRPAQLANAGK
ncbi:L,D-transpeptidase family protein [Sphingomonas lutea]|uniref:L,D-transpeptidase family protein n=1 Tax=Sphingomonas lutea TaxID=1045317 RepID=A0A7G9SGP6_9SPHN|nr:L,D-transpeptidase family protein [Sphingomonas lutea]QNN67021.1 L,D-transpeptidase family protein [Sphingomonas lutea]